MQQFEVVFNWLYQNCGDKLANVYIRWFKILVIGMEKTVESKKCRKVGPYILLRQIGKGSYSTVYEATSEGKTFAVKQINLQNLAQKNLQRIHQELEVLTIIKHKNIVSLVDFKQTSHNLYLVFEHCKNTDLNVFIQQHYDGKLPEQQVRRILMQLKGAFQAMRSHKIVHRDLKLHNILVTEDFEVKLADFGFAKLLEHNEFLTSFVGTPLTMAPQVFARKKYNQKCDIWSIGIITYQMLFGQNPFFNNKAKLTYNEIKDALRQPLVFPFDVHPLAKDLIQRMLVPDPEKRMDFPQFFAHAWLQEESGCLSQLLRGEVLRAQLTRSLCSSSKPSLQKQFIMQNCQAILIYSLIQFIRSYIENSITTWINLAKHLLQMGYQNKRLNFLALAVLLENVDQTIASSRVVILNTYTKLQIPPFLSFRELQSWPMNEYSKRMPGFIAKGRSTINEYLQGEGKVKFSKEEGQIPLSQLFFKQMENEVKIMNPNESNNDLKLFLKIRSWEGHIISINVTSNVLSTHAMSILIRNVSFKVNYHQLCKKCSSLFRLAMVSRPTNLEQGLLELRGKLLSDSLEE